jgi:hypothetical protein
MDHRLHTRPRPNEKELNKHSVHIICIFITQFLHFEYYFFIECNIQNATLKKKYDDDWRNAEQFHKSSFSKHQNMYYRSKYKNS